MWFLASLIGLSSFLYYKRKAWFRLCLSLIETLTQKPAEPLPLEHVYGQVYVATYLHEGRKYKLYLPLNKTRPLRLEETLYAEINDCQIALNGQQPGVPYFITASDFHPECRLNLWSEDDECIVTFKGDEKLTF
jgi:hypothetical protein